MYQLIMKLWSLKLTIKIEITIDDEDSKCLFEKEAPWYGKILANMDILDKNEKIAEAISKNIDKGLIDKGITAKIDYNVL